MYQTIHFFRDLMDDGYIYRPGDTFPRDGMKVDRARIAELSGNDNARGKPLIVEVKKPTRKRVKKDA